MSNIDFETILDAYGPQLGEMIWHSVHCDESLASVSESHANRIIEVVEQFKLLPQGRPIRILEIGAYAHHDVALACARLSGPAVGWVHDISPKSLRVGIGEAIKRGLQPATPVAGDFHRLPFTDDFFDLVFCAACIHHTFQPSRVLLEMLRIVRPGGLVRIENEPVGRKFCFYQFRGNRPESRSEFERRIDDVGLTWTISSPFPGSRPETLFGMIENDRIPLGVYTDTISKFGQVETLDLIPQVAEFEREVLALARDCELDTRIFEKLSQRCAQLRGYMGRSDRVLGFELPENDKIWLLCYETAERLRQLEGLTDEDHKSKIADLFGATLRASIRKIGNEQPISEVPYLRKLYEQDGILMDLPQLSNVKLDLAGVHLPEIEMGSSDAVQATYSEPEWICFTEANGLHSVLNRGEIGHIPLPSVDVDCLMLIRFYAVARQSGVPYIVQFTDANGDELSRHLICQAESHLSRFLVPRGNDKIVMKLQNLDEGPANDLHCYIHIGVARLIPVEIVDSAAPSGEHEDTCDFGAEDRVTS